MIGVGVDAVEVPRFRRSLERTPGMCERLFTEAELEFLSTRTDPVPGLAARFAAREAVMKALGLGLGAFGFHDVSVDIEGDGPTGRPSLVVTGRAAELAEAAGVRTWHVSLTHVDSLAIAMVIGA